MNRIFTVVHAALRSMTRECPKCKRRQIVPASKFKEAVVCKECGASIPAPRRR